MDHSSSWQANSPSADQENPRLLWNQIVYYHVHKSPPPVPMVNHMNSFHNLDPYLFKINLNIILQSVTSPSK
jgi:hypothetical protein